MRKLDIETERDFRGDLRSDISLEMLSEAFLKELEKVRQLVDDSEFEDEPADDENGDDSEYSEVYGGDKGDLKKYQEKFMAYAEKLKQAVEQLYGEKHAKESANEKTEKATEEQMKTPWERGHKLGCGCPGCSAYREFHGIRLDGKNQGYMGGAMAMRTAEGKKETSKYEEASSKPCGGKLYHHFHGERAELRNVFGQQTKRFNFGRAGY